MPDIVCQRPDTRTLSCCLRATPPSIELLQTAACGSSCQTSARARSPNSEATSALPERIMDTQALDAQPWASAA